VPTVVVIVLTGLVIWAVVAVVRRSAPRKPHVTVTGSNHQVMDLLAGLFGLAPSDVTTTTKSDGLLSVLKDPRRGVIAELDQMSSPASGPSPLQDGFSIDRVAIVPDLAAKAEPLLAKFGYRFKSMGYRGYAIYTHRHDAEVARPTQNATYPARSGPPWHVSSEDHAVANEICIALRSQFYPRVVKTQTGDQIEVVGDLDRPDADEPALILARTWDPERASIVSMATLHPAIKLVVDGLLRSHGYQELFSAPGMPAVYVRRPYVEPQATELATTRKRVTCAQCGAELRLEERSFGSVLHCPRCGAVRKAQASARLPHDSDITADRDGSSPERAIVVGSVIEEYAWVAQNCPGLTVEVQAVILLGERPLDMLTLRSEAGETRDVFFDVSAIL